MRAQFPVHAHRLAARRPALPLLALCGLLLGPGVAAAASLADALDAALALAASQPRADALRQVAAAVRTQAAGLIAADPALRLKGVSDRGLSDQGAYELEAMVDLPLWLPGQRDARTALANATSAQADALERRLRWEMAGVVREAAWAVALAAAAMRQAQAAQESAAQLADSIARRAAAGDLARLDTLQAQAETAARAADLQASKAAFDQALAAWVALTGRTDLPEPLLEPAPDLSRPLALPEEHPLLAAAASDLAWADADRRRVSADRRGHPLLGLGGRQTRDGRGTGTDEALQLELNIPFGSRRQSAPAQASAEQAFTERLTAAHQTRREAERTLAVALAAVQGDRARLAAAKQRAAAAGEAAALTRRAYSLGEGELATLLQIEARAAEARLALELTRLEQGRDIARLQQALGVLP